MGVAARMRRGSSIIVVVWLVWLASSVSMQVAVVIVTHVGALVFLPHTVMWFHFSCVYAYSDCCWYLPIPRRLCFFISIA